ncbi:MAG: nuclear transport factor 2 family protein [Lautropia sp.]
MNAAANPASTPGGTDTAELAPADAQACIAVVTRFFANLDASDYQGIQDLMLPDAEWHRQGKVLKPGPGLLDELGKRSLTRTVIHVLTNLDARYTGPDGALVTGYMTAYAYDNGKAIEAPAPLEGPSSIGGVHVDLRRAGGTWRIAKSRSRPIFKRS